MKPYLEAFLNHIVASNSYSHHTELAYRNDIAQFFLFFEDLDSHELTQDHAYEYLAHLYELKLSPSSVSRKVSTLRSYFKFLQINYGLVVNPFSHIQVKQQSRTLPNFLTHAEMDQLLLSCEDDLMGQRNAVLIELMYACGLRLSELTSLQCAQINIEERSLEIIGKGNKQRRLFFYPDLVPKLQHYINHVRVLLMKGDDHDYLFVNQHGHPIQNSGVSYILKQQGIKAGLRQSLHPHMLRHTFATHLIDNGASIRIVQTLLGHESLSTTQIYTHVSLRRIKIAYESAMEQITLT